MILITHDLGVAAGLADRIAVMYAGQIIEAAPTSRTFEQPIHPYTDALLKAVPRLDRPVARLPAVPGAVPSASAWPPGCRFHPRCPHRWDRCAAALPELLTASADRHARCWLVEEPDRRTG